MKTLLIGLGNPILCDDGVGWRVVQQVAKSLQGDQKPEGGQPVDLEIDCLSLGGISLMERLIGADRAILVDAIQTEGGIPGTVYRLTPDDLPTFNANAVHDASFKAALELGRRLGAKLPEEIVIYAIEAENLWEFGEWLTPAVQASVLPVAQAVYHDLSNSTHSLDGRLSFSAHPTADFKETEGI